MLGGGKVDIVGLYMARLLYVIILVHTVVSVIRMAAPKGSKGITLGFLE